MRVDNQFKVSFGKYRLYISEKDFDRLGSIAEGSAEELKFYKYLLKSYTYQDIKEVNKLKFNDLKLNNGTE